jgi:hypothetical protein
MYSKINNKWNTSLNTSNKAANTKDISSIKCGTDKESFTIKMEGYMTESGSRIRWTATGCYIINRENWLMKAFGKAINSKERGSYTTKALNSCTKPMIMLVLTKSTSIGLIMKVIFI